MTTGRGSWRAGQWLLLSNNRGSARSLEPVRPPSRQVVLSSRCLLSRLVPIARQRAVAGPCDEIIKGRPVTFVNIDEDAANWLGTVTADVLIGPAFRAQRDRRNHFCSASTAATSDDALPAAKATGSQLSAIRKSVRSGCVQLRNTCRGLLAERLLATCRLFGTDREDG